MGITSEVSSIIQSSKEQFEKAMTTSLTVDVLKNIVLRSMPAEGNEMEKINDPKFRESFNRLLNPITANLIDKFQSVGQFDTGNLFTSMVTSISDSVSLESAYRTESLESKFLLDKIPVTQDKKWIGEIEKTYESLKFSNKEIKERFTQKLKYIYSFEAGSKVIDDIKNEVKQSIDETEAKNELVEGTLQEIADYKKEVAPPDDEYVDAENPDDQAKAGDEGEGGEGEEGEPGTDEGEGGGEGEADAGPEGGDETGETRDNPEPAGEDGASDTQEGDDAASDLGEEGDTSDLDSGDGLEGGDELGGDETNLNTDELEGGDTAASDSDSDSGSGKKANVIININAGGESITANSLSKAKAKLPLYTAESFARRYIPANDIDLNAVEFPDVKLMASECVNAIGDPRKEIDIRIAGVKLAIDKGSATSKEDKKVLSEKLDKLSSISSEALYLAETWGDSMQKLGITQNGLLDSRESTLFIARNIISRFLTGSKVPRATPLPYTSRENFLSNAFDIIQIRQDLKSKENPLKAAVDDLMSRENVFYHNVVSIDDKETKEKATAVIDLADMEFKKALTANFITDWKIKTWEQNVGKDQKDTNAEVISRVEKKFENLWQRPLNTDEKAIVSATTNNQDVTEIIPTPYEKFLIKLTRESSVAKEGESNMTLKPVSKQENESNRFKAKVFTSMIKSFEHFNLIDKYDLMEIDKFCNSTNINLLHLGKSAEN
jgi:hypothetical protein